MQLNIIFKFCLFFFSPDLCAHRNFLLPKISLCRIYSFNVSIEQEIAQQKLIIIKHERNAAKNAKLNY